ncbi:hypothetical protein T440DRAFT_470973 [Plenodomus tracheiphilus IPT5]|uniref:Uncharacterized protein n=1 Tax=Plenodomus tracheiphilus IPT5 TaxID=1408161 RepID=A0A6A7AYJ2_9PLEO|nr:hypothetical protein T440DRAFT_470973 [Plenodomus tracheiphilus IPT5]
MFCLQPARARALQRTSQQVMPITTRARFLSNTPVRAATKGAEDKDTLKPTSTEYSKSGSDDSAAHSDAAFNPNVTKPEAEEASVEKEAGGKDNSLNASPSNTDISEPNSAGVGGNGGAPHKKKSGAGGAPKNGS